ncbi:hypothetical protein [Streptomyces sp. NPDC005281]|uniref:hypothetical protein n=1 Tax=Streptomyces sp. NPDC005281 TaxID=3155712 RepID=UPI0033AC95EF
MTRRQSDSACTPGTPATGPFGGPENRRLGSLLLDRRTRDIVRLPLAAHLTTATDALRLPHVRSGGEADLIELRRFRSLPRPAEDAAGFGAEAVAKRRVLPAPVHGEVDPEGASGSVHPLLPGPVDGCGPDALTAGDLVTALG